MELFPNTAVRKSAMVHADGCVGSDHEIEPRWDCSCGAGIQFALYYNFCVQCALPKPQKSKSKNGSSDIENKETAVSHHALKKLNSLKKEDISNKAVVDDFECIDTVTDVNNKNNIDANSDVDVDGAKSVASMVNNAEAPIHPSSRGKRKLGLDKTISNNDDFGLPERKNKKVPKKTANC